MEYLADRQCRHPVQPMGGVCATCLKERLSKISGLHCRSDAATTGNASIVGMKLEREASTLNTPPLKQLLGQKFDFCYHVEDADEMSNEVIIMSQDVAEAPRQSIACLIERDIIEAHRRYSDVASRCCYEPSHNQLLRSKSTSQLDAYSQLDGKSLHLICNHRRQPGIGRKNMTSKSLKESKASSAMRPLAYHHDLLRGTASPQCHHDHSGQRRFELQDKTALSLLTKSKSTGWILNHHLGYNRNKRSERRSPIELWSWHKKRKTSSVSNASLEDSAPLMMSPCSRKNGASSSMKTKEIMWRPLKRLFKWKGTSRKPSCAPPTASSCTPQSSDSSSSLCTHEGPPEQKLHHDIPLPTLSDHPKLDHAMGRIYGRRLHRLLSQVRRHSTFNGDVMVCADEKVDVDASVEQTVCYLEEGIPCLNGYSQDVDSVRNAVSQDNVKSSPLEQGSTKGAGEEVLFERGQGTNALSTQANEVSDSPMLSSRVFKVATSESSPTRKSSCSMVSSVPSSLPSLATLMDTSMIYSNRPSDTCVLSIAALISMDVKRTSSLKMAC